jgi:phage shock protein E
MEHILDVRTKEEFESGAVDGAINLPVEDILAGVLPRLEKDTEIGVYCRSGGRSGVAKEALERQGFTHVTNLGGLGDVGLG